MSFLPGLIAYVLTPQARTVRTPEQREGDRANGAVFSALAVLWLLFVPPLLWFGLPRERRALGDWLWERVPTLQSAPREPEAPRRPHRAPKRPKRHRTPQVEDKSDRQLALANDLLSPCLKGGSNDRKTTLS
jgi:hypothetical protein